ncbi:hypothetical protein J31TS3_33990 [Paenibacillus lactis]|nr:hypothetical protein J31TS3_33990 [Paenibacillus lactis]
MLPARVAPVITVPIMPSPASLVSFEIFSMRDLVDGVFVSHSAHLLNDPIQMYYNQIAVCIRLYTINFDCIRMYTYRQPKKIRRTPDPNRMDCLMIWKYYGDSNMM